MWKFENLTIFLTTFEHLILSLVKKFTLVVKTFFKGNVTKEKSEPFFTFETPKTSKCNRYFYPPTPPLVKNILCHPIFTLTSKRSISLYLELIESLSTFLIENYLLFRGFKTFTIVWKQLTLFRRFFLGDAHLLLLRNYGVLHN